MKNWIFGAIAHIAQWFQSLQVKRVVAIAFMGVLLLTNGIDVRNADSENSGLAKGIQDEAHSKNSERPKTTGEFLDEARGDVPLDERIGNIVRDSKEAFQDWGEEYGKGIRKTGQQIQDGAERLGDDAADAVR